MISFNFLTLFHIEQLISEISQFLKIQYEVAKKNLNFYKIDSQLMFSFHVFDDVAQSVQFLFFLDKTFPLLLVIFHCLTLNNSPHR